MSDGFGMRNFNASRPKLPPLDEQKDDMGAYLERYEWFTTSQEWDEGYWAVSLSPLLTGKGLQVYSSTPPDNANNYEKLKTALLQRYELTEDGFGWKLRENQPEVRETVFQFVARLRRFFTKWTDMAKCEKSFNGFSELLIRKQFLNTVGLQYNTVCWEPTYATAL